MVCPGCGSEVLEGKKFCATCGTALGSQNPPAIAPRAPAPMVTPGTVPVFYKNPGLAAVFSFLWCGSGQIYNGNIATGILLLIGHVFNVFCFFLGFAVFFLSWFFCFFWFFVWIWSIYNAYQSAEEYNRRIGGM